MKRKMMMFAALLAMCVAIASAAWTVAQEAKQDQPAPAAQPGRPPRPNDVAAFMQLKLNHAQKVLEGVAVENFDQIARHSQQMGLLAQDANWRVYQTPEYRNHSADFQRIAADLTKAAKDRNLDSAALAYVQLTMTCVNCHKYTRGVRMAQR